MASALRKAVLIEVEAKTEGAARGFDKLRGSVDEAKKTAEAARNALISMFGVGTLVAINRAVESTAKYQAVMSSLPISVERAQRMVGGLVDKMDLASAAQIAMRSGLVKSESDFNRFATNVVKVGLSVGKTASESLELTSALAKGRTEQLEQFGIIIKTEEAYALYARQIGKTKDKLTEHEKVVAAQTIGLQKLQEAADKTNITVSDSVTAWQRLTVTLSDSVHVAMELIAKDLDDQQVRLTEQLNAIQDLVLGWDVATAKVRGIAGDTPMEAFAAQQKAKADATARVAQEALVEEALVEETKRKKPKRQKGGGGGPSMIETAANIDLIGDGEFVSEIDTSDLEAERERTMEIEMAKNEARYEARIMGIEQMEADGIDEISIIRANEAAESEHLEFVRSITTDKVSLIEQESKAQQIHHRSRLGQLKAERDAEKRRYDSLMSLTRQSVDVTARSAISIAEATGAGAKAQWTILGIQGAIMAALSIADAARSYASYDYVAGAGHTVAAAAYVVESALAFAEAGGGGSAGGARTSTPTVGQTASQTEQRTNDTGTPMSQSEDLDRSGNASAGKGGKGGGGVNVTINNPYIFSDDEETGVKLRRVLRRAEETAGGTV